MNRSLLVGLLLAGCAACYGALVSSRGGASQPQRTQDDPFATIDKSSVPKLEPVRAPAEVGETAMQHVRTIVSFGPRHPGVAFAQSAAPPV